MSQALDWSLDPNQDGDFDDHLDVVNLSLGTDYATPDDPENDLVRRLIEHGVMVVFSAGNGGDLYDISGKSLEALVVASSRDSYVLRDAIEATAPSEVAGAGVGQYSVNFNRAGLDRIAPVVRLHPVLDVNRDGCVPFGAADAAAVNGKYVWLEWDDNDATRRCGSGARTNNATAAGAVGVLLSSTLNDFSAGIAGNATIPAFQMTKETTDRLRPALEAGTLEVRMADQL